MSEPIATGNPAVPQDAASAPPQKRVNWRLVLLLGLLGLMLFALWYDYKVARVKVERAYSQVAELNSRINASASFKATTSADIQQILGRTPSRVFVEGPFTVEAYSWMAGWPVGVQDLETNPTIGLRCHEYFAVYLGSGPNALFMKQYMFAIPPGELEEKPPGAMSVEGTETETEAFNSSPEVPQPPQGGSSPRPGRLIQLEEWKERPRRPDLELEPDQTASEPSEAAADGGSQDP